MPTSTARPVTRTKSKLNSWYTQNTDGNYRAPKSAYLDGGDGNDSLNISGYLEHWNGSTTATAIGGLGDDISVTDNSRADSGYTSVCVDGEDDDTITVAGSFSTSITTGTGNDTVICRRCSIPQTLVGAQLIYSPDGTSTAINPDPLITDFTTGSAGDILDYGNHSATPPWIHCSNPSPLLPLPGQATTRCAIL